MAGIGGLTQPPVPPGGSFDYRFTPPDSGFNLYRPHVGRGDAGPDRRAGSTGRSSSRSRRRRPCDLEAIVALADWRLDPTGLAARSRRGRSRAARAASARSLAANNRPTPLALTAAPGARVRLRLANAANARMMVIRIEGVKPLIIALDGQPGEAFEPLRNAFPIGPGARFDMMFDMPRDASAGPLRAARRRGGARSPARRTAR